MNECLQNATIISYPIRFVSQYSSNNSKCGVLQLCTACIFAYFGSARLFAVIRGEVAENTIAHKHLGGLETVYQDQTPFGSHR